MAMIKIIDYSVLKGKFTKGFLMGTKKQEKIVQELKFFEQSKDIEKVGSKKLKDRYYLALLLAWKSFRAGEMYETFLSLLTGLQGGSVQDEKSIQNCLKNFNQKLGEKDGDNK